MILFIFSITAVINLVASESCFYQRCLGCYPQEMISAGSLVECHPRNWVSAQWVLNYGHPPPSTDSRIPIEYSCLKMVATPDDKTYGNTMDVIRGCIPRAQIDSVCLGLIAVEKARGHSDVRCFICNGDSCNSSTRLQKTPLLFILALSLYYIFRWK